MLFGRHFQEKPRLLGKPGHSVLMVSVTWQGNGMGAPRHPGANDNTRVEFQKKSPAEAGLVAIVTHPT
jgi:hypothetical protein